MRVCVTLNGGRRNLEAELAVQDLTHGEGVTVCQGFFGPAPRSETLRHVADALSRLGLPSGEKRNDRPW